jgi:hypothetical protein
MKPIALLYLLLFLGGLKAFASNKTLDGNPLIVLEDPSQSSAPKSGVGLQEEKKDEDQVRLQAHPETETEEAVKKNPISFKRLDSKVRPPVNSSSGLTSNLPTHYLVSQFSKQTDTESFTLLPTDSVKEKLKSIRPGDILRAQVEHSVIAFADEKAPVVARIMSGSLASSRLVGFSRLESNSNRVFIDFELLSPKSKTSSFSFKGTALTELGTPGFEGIYHSKEAKYFAGDFISTFMAAYFDAQVPKYMNPFGGTIEDTSMNSATKKALSQSAMSSAERFREKLKKFPEFSELKGPFEIQVLVLAPAIEN